MNHNLRAVMGYFNLTQEKAAEFGGVTRQTITNHLSEKSTRRVTPYTHLAVAAGALGLSPLSEKATLAYVSDLTVSRQVSHNWRHGSPPLSARLAAALIAHDPTTSLKKERFDA